MASEPEAKEQLMIAVVVVMMMVLQLTFNLSEILKFLVDSAAELREVTYDFAESFGKRWVFGVDTTTDR